MPTTERATPAAIDPEALADARSAVPAEAIVTL